MSQLSDRTIKQMVNERTLKIEPWEESLLQPASLDLRLGSEIMLPTMTGDVPIVPGVTDPADHFSKYKLSQFGFGSTVASYVMDPGEFLLAHTLERIFMPRFMAGRVEGKSSLGRWGLFVHVTAGFIDPGFEGQITLELVNCSKGRIRITEGMAISQISFFLLTTAVDKSYHGKYQGQDGVQPGR